MKYRTLIINIFLLLLVSGLPIYVYAFHSTIAYAKPPQSTPTANTYISPFEIQSYPDPGIPLNQNEFCVDPNKACVWGMYYTDTWRWFISKHTTSADPDAIVNLCIAQENPYEQICFRHRNGYNESLQYVEYTDGMSVYQSIPMYSIPVSPCGYWGAMPDTSSWNSESMELHQPNWYNYPCVSWDNPIFLPFIKR